MQPNQALQTLFILIFLSTKISNINGHALLIAPASRNWLDRLNGNPRNYCPHCLNQGGICGSTSGFNYNGPIENYEVIGDFKPGEVIDIEIVVNAHHKGHFEYFLCDAADIEGGTSSAATQECLNKHPLIVVQSNGENSLQVIDNNHPERHYLPPTCALETASGFGVNDITGYYVTGKVMLPTEVTCSHCVLQWHWMTANSCNPEGYQEASFPDDDCASWWNPSLGACGTGEEFWNCADLTITPEEGTVVPNNPTEVASSAPTSTPNLRTNQPTRANANAQESEEPTSSPTFSPTLLQTNEPTQVYSYDQGSDDGTFSVECVDEWAQCGGRGYTGSTECCEGTVCVESNEWWSSCQYVANPNEQCRAHWQQCGGIGYGGLRNCCAGLNCKEENDYWSSCQ